MRVCALRVSSFIAVFSRMTHWRSSLARRCSMTACVLCASASFSAAAARLASAACSPSCCFSHCACCSANRALLKLISRFRLLMVASRGPAAGVNFSKGRSLAPSHHAAAR